MKKRFTRDSEQKIHSIYNAFKELVNEVGYDRLTTRQVAIRAQISVGTVYHYFKEGKASIAAGLYEKNLLETLIIQNLVGYHFNDLRSQIIRHLQLHKENKELYRAFDLAIYSDSDIFNGLKRNRDGVLLEQLGKDAFRLDDIMRVYITVDSIIHRHLFVESLFDTDGELVNYLTKIAEAAYQFNPEV